MAKRTPPCPGPEDDQGSAWQAWLDSTDALFSKHDYRWHRIRPDHSGDGWVVVLRAPDGRLVAESAALARIHELEASARSRRRRPCR